MRSLYLHIGMHKTGTTAIQAFLSRNADVLRRKGYEYPSLSSSPADNWAHHELAWVVTGMKGPNWKAPTEGIRELFRQIRESGKKSIILSAEDFSSATTSQCEAFRDQLARELGKDFTIKVIVYFRRPDHWLESAYQTSITNPVALSSKSFRDYFIENAADSFKLMDYERVLTAWESAFGRPALCVRVYEKQQQPHGIFHDFLSTVGIELTDEFLEPRRADSYVGLSGSSLEFMRICNRHFADVPGMAAFVHSTLRDAGSKQPYQSYSLMSPAERREILARFDSMNRRIAREYLGREDGVLFREPWPEPDAAWEPPPELKLEDALPVLVKALYDLKKANESLRDRKWTYGRIKKKIPLLDSIDRKLRGPRSD